VFSFECVPERSLFKLSLPESFYPHPSAQVLSFFLHLTFVARQLPARLEVNPWSETTS